jgi:hypothetical protein
VGDFPPAVVLLPVQRIIPAADAIDLEHPDVVARHNLGEARESLVRERRFARSQLLRVANEAEDRLEIRSSQSHRASKIRRSAYSHKRGQR